MNKSIVVVTLAINTGTYQAMGTYRNTLYFEEYPTSQDIRDVLEEDVKFKEFFECCEVEEVGDFHADYEANDNFISFDCNDEDGTIGNVLIELHPLYATTSVSV